MDALGEEEGTAMSDAIILIVRAAILLTFVLIATAVPYTLMRLNWYMRRGELRYAELHLQGEAHERRIKKLEATHDSD